MDSTRALFLFLMFDCAQTAITASAVLTRRGQRGQRVAWLRSSSWSRVGLSCVRPSSNLLPVRVECDCGLVGQALCGVGAVLSSGDQEWAASREYRGDTDGFIMVDVLLAYGDNPI
jgi:hypothetical protein